MTTAVLRVILVLSAVSAACSGGSGARSPQTNLLLEATGLETLRIGQATVADATSYFGLLEAEWTKASGNGLVSAESSTLAARAGPFSK